MAEIPVFTIPGEQKKEPRQFFTRVFCLRKDPPPLGLLVAFLKSKGATPVLPEGVNEKLLNSWNWVGVEIGYQKDRKPILLTCCRKGSAQDEIFTQNVEGLKSYVDTHRELDSWRVSDHLGSCRFFVASILDKNDITDEGYDFNGWVLQFFEENCDGMVQIDGQGFYGPEGDIILDLPPIDDEHEKEEPAASDLISPTPLKQTGQA
jgi:hypothetical protein